MIAQILIADDDAHFTDVLREHLEQKGHRVIATLDGFQATLKAHEHAPHLIILDLQMPGAYGSTVFQNLRQDAKTSSIPVLFLSAFITPEIKDRIPSGPNVRYLEKPFTWKRLDELIQELLPLGGYVP